MKYSKGIKVYLIIAGALLSFIGGATLLAPIEMKASAGIDLMHNISIINDVRAASALLLTFGVLSILGGWIKTLNFTTLVTSTFIFLSLGIGRLISILIDGMPVDGLVKATGLELILATMGMVLLIINKKSVK